MDENADPDFYPPQPPEDRKKKGPPPLVTVTLFAVSVFFIGLVLGNILWLLTADVLAFGKEEQSICFTVSDTDSVKDISQNLHDQGLVRYPWLFRLYVKVTGKETALQPGTYTLSTHYDYHALVKVLSAGNVRGSAQTFPALRGEKENLWRIWNY